MLSSWNVYDYAKIFFCGIGLYATLCWLIDNLSSLAQIVINVLLPFFQPNASKTLAEKYGNWAVITGATDGIGKEYAKNLASQNINVVLIARSKDKLIQTANEIEFTYRVKTKWIQADFSQDNEIYKHIENELKGIPVGILVNNVGTMYDEPNKLGYISEQDLLNLLNVNTKAVTMMTRMLINDMKSRGKGAVVNISSGSELQPIPYAALYAASKVFVKSLTLALQYEYAPYGITVQLVTPLYVITKMNDYSSTVMKGGLFYPDVVSYTKSAVFTLGKTDKTTGYWAHSLQYAFIKLGPEWLRVIGAYKLHQFWRKESLEIKKNKIK